MYRRRHRKRVAPKARFKEEKCKTPWCKNRKALKFTRYKSARTGKLIVYENHLSVCWKCHAQILKERHPETYVMNALRGRARQRGIPWTITLVEFRQWCRKTGYLEKRGREAGSASIDRKDHDKGYHIWNIQIRTFLENCTLGHFVPGKDCKQNEPVPTEYNYDFDGPGEAEPAGAMANEPF